MRSRHRPSSRPSWLCTVLLLAPMSASGATLYSAEAYTFGGPRDGDVGPTPVSATAGIDIRTPTLRQFAEASASAGLSLAAAAAASVYAVNIPPCCGFSAFSVAIAQFSGYDVILSGPSGESTLTSFNLIFDGTAGVSIGASSSGPSGAVTDALGGPGPLALTTSSLLVGAGDVVTIGLKLTASAACATDPQVLVASCSASSNARSFSFPLGGPVFNLPAGWTANSVDGTIVNNVFVPEPSTALLLAGGVIGLVGHWRRRGRRADGGESPW